MKVRIDIDCTPEEARAFFGLPPVAELQQEAMAVMAEKVREAMAASDPETLMRAWLPSGLEGWEEMQKAFWSSVQGASGKKD